MSTSTSAPLDIRSLIAKLDRECRQLLSDAADLAYRSAHSVLDIEHVLAVRCNSTDYEWLRRVADAGMDISAMRAQLAGFLGTFATVHGLPPALSERLVTVLRDAWVSVSFDTLAPAVDIDTLLRTVIANQGVFARICVDVPALTRLAHAVAPASKLESRIADAPAPGSTLAKHTSDLTARAVAGGIDPVIGRDAEISQLIEILLRRRQNNPILIGEAGVGKTAIVEGLALRIAAGLVPKALRDVRLCSLDMAMLRAGASMRGEIEARLKAIIAEVASSERPVILFIDEAHTIVAGAGGQSDQSDIANLIKPELARGSLRTIAATTWAEYKRFFEKDAALSRRFQAVRVDEPTALGAEDILQGLVPALQKHHGIYITQSAIAAAVRLSSRYLVGRQLPDKAISVLDTACARAVAQQSGPASDAVSLTQRMRLLEGRLGALTREAEWSGSADEAIEHTRQAIVEMQSQLQACDAPVRHEGDSPDARPPVRVSDEDVAAVIADWTGVPSQKMLADQYSLVTRLEQALARRVVGQPEACRAICDRIRAYAAKLEDPSRPIGVFMLVGPSGVGKTETAHALAETFFGAGSMTVINMTEYQEAHSVSKLKGAPAGYLGFGQGGVLTEAIRRRPYGLLLLDEVDRAHPDVLDLFLQVFDKGFMEDAEGVAVDFKNTLVILTSNVGDGVLAAVPAQAGSPEGRCAPHQGLQRALLEVFQPAFLGRTQVVPFFPLSVENLREIVHLKLDAIGSRFDRSYHHPLSFSTALVDAMVDRCASQVIGARWIDQFISENILSRLSVHVLGCLAQGVAVGALHVGLDGERVCVEPLASDAPVREHAQGCP